LLEWCARGRPSVVKPGSASFFQICKTAAHGPGRHPAANIKSKRVAGGQDLIDRLSQKLADAEQELKEAAERFEAAAKS